MEILKRTHSAEISGSRKSTTPSISQRGERFQLYKLRVKLSKHFKTTQPNGEIQFWSFNTQKIFGTLSTHGGIATYQTMSFDGGDQNLVHAHQNNDSDNNNSDRKAEHCGTLRHRSGETNPPPWNKKGRTCTTQESIPSAVSKPRPPSWPLDWTLSARSHYSNLKHIKYATRVCHMSVTVTSHMTSVTCPSRKMSHWRPLHFCHRKRHISGWSHFDNMKSAHNPVAFNYGEPWGWCNEYEPNILVNYKWKSSYMLDTQIET